MTTNQRPPPEVACSPSNPAAAPPLAEVEAATMTVPVRVLFPAWLLRRQRRLARLPLRPRRTGRSRELRRVIQLGGELRFYEYVVSPDLRLLRVSG